MLPEHGLLASELQLLVTFSKLSYPKEDCPLRTTGCVLAQKIPLWLRVTPFTSMWSWSVALIFIIYKAGYGQSLLQNNAVRWPRGHLDSLRKWDANEHPNLHNCCHLHSVRLQTWGGLCYDNFAVPFMGPHEIWGAFGTTALARMKFCVNDADFPRND